MTDNKKLATKLREAAKRAEYFQTGEQGLLNRAAEVIEAAGKAHTPTAGSCWDAAPQVVRSGECDPMPTLCELTAGHKGAHRSGQTEWMHSRPHTPTDDEREVHRRVIDLWFANWRSIGKVSPALELAIDSLEGMVSDALDAGSQRSEVPEPSAGEKIEWPDHWTTNEKLRDLHARWHDQKGNLLGREACGWESCEFWDAAHFTLRLADVHIAGREPQGEPSDAQVQAFIAAINAEGFVLDRRAAKAGLRAAGGAR